MGLLKKILIGAAAVAAAPVVAPFVAAGAAAAAGAVAAAGTAAAGAAAAAGTAAAGAAGAAAAAVGGAAAAAGSAIAGTAAGSAAIGAATTAAATVGTAVGSAAGAVGLTSVAAATGTTAGAAAVGTITASAATGAAAGINAKTKFNKASEIAEHASSKYNVAKKQYDLVVNQTKVVMNKLADSKKKVADACLNFNNIFAKIKNPTRFGEIVVNEKYCEGVNVNLNTEAYGISLESFAKNIIKAYSAGNLAGVALTGGITSTITVAGTGTAMSALSGAAATNATMAALGGGTLASGGLGMAGGAIMAKGLVFAPALAIGGLMLSNEASKAIDKAKEYDRKANKVVGKINTSQRYMSKLGNCMSCMNNNITDTLYVYNKVYKQIDKIVFTDKHIDAAKMTKDEIKTFYAAIGLVKVLEVQANKKFIKSNVNIEKLNEDSVVSLQEIINCKYTNNIVNFKNVEDFDLGRYVNEVLREDITNNLCNNNVKNKEDEKEKTIITNLNGYLKNQIKNMIETSNAKGLYNLGYKLENTDIELAKLCYEEASEIGFSVAAHRLRFLETNTEKMENKIVPTKNKSIKYINIEDEIRTLLFKRDAKGLYDLGVLLEEQNDIENAKKCYKEASNLSFMSAYNKLRYLQSKGL